MCPTLNSLHKNIFPRYDLLKTLLVGMDHGKGLKNRGTFASEASGLQKLEKLHLGGNLKFFGYGVNEWYIEWSYSYNKRIVNSFSLQLISSIVLWSSVLYIISFIGYYLLLFPPTWPMRILYATPFFVAPVFIFLINKYVNHFLEKRYVCITYLRVLISVCIMCWDIF